MLRTFINYVKKSNARRIERQIAEQQFIMKCRSAGAAAAKERGYSVWAAQLTREMWEAHEQIVKLKKYLNTLATPR